MLLFPAYQYFQFEPLLYFASFSHFISSMTLHCWLWRNPWLCVWHSLVTGRGRELTRALPVPHWAPAHTAAWWLVTTQSGSPTHSGPALGHVTRRGGGHQPSSPLSQHPSLISDHSRWMLQQIVSRSHYCSPGWCVASPLPLAAALVPARFSQDSGSRRQRESCESRRSRPGTGQA